MASIITLQGGVNSSGHDVYEACEEEREIQMFKRSNTHNSGSSLSLVIGLESSQEGHTVAGLSFQLPVSD